MNSQQLALSVKQLSVSFGGIKAADSLSFDVARGDLVGVIGPNGAGKTTAIRLITGVYRPSAGSITVQGTDVTQMSVHERARRGLAHTHQIVRPFREMSMLDNVTLAAGSSHTLSPLRALVRASRRAEEERAMHLLRRVGLESVARRDSGTLPLGQLKRLEMARAMALDPSVILLDEPLAGLNSSEAAAMSETILGINAAGTTVLLVEHNLSEVLRISRRMLVLVAGRIVGDGIPSEVIRSEIVMDAYLGNEHEEVTHA